MSKESGYKVGQVRVAMRDCRPFYLKGDKFTTIGGNMGDFNGFPGQRVHQDGLWSCSVSDKASLNHRVENICKVYDPIGLCIYESHDSVLTANWKEEVFGEDI